MPLVISTNPTPSDNFKLPFAEQIAFFKQKLNLPTERWDDIMKAAHDKAFIVAGAQKADLLNDLRLAVDTSIAEGKTIQWFRQEFENIVAKNGWTGWTGEGDKVGRDWRTRVIYQTNLSTSYAAGRYQQLTDPDLLKVRPYWKYVHSDTVLHPRPLHLSWNGVVLRHDDPWWQTHFCPNGWGCRCRVIAVRAKEYKGKPAPNDGTYNYVDKGTGEIIKLPKGIDYGWDYAPEANTTASLKSLVEKKLIAYPPAIADALKADLALVEPVVPQEKIVADYLKLYDFKNIATQLKNKELAGFLNLSEAEHSMIHTYTASGFVDINRMLNGLEPYKENALPVLEKASAALSQGLNKLPNYKALVIRRVDLPAEILAKYQKGEIVTHNAFTSATYGTEDVFDGKVRMKIFSKNGKRIDKFSTKDDEFEVLFDKGTQFKVKNREEKMLNRYEKIIEITLEEV